MGGSLARFHSAWQADPGADRTAARLAAIERSLARYGCFDLTEDDVVWLIQRVRASLGQEAKAEDEGGQRDH